MICTPAIMPENGVLLMNVGTPDEPTVPAIKRYLREFLLDPDVINIPAIFRHLLVRGIILNTRPRKIAPLYASIWMDEGSPLNVYSQRLSHALNESLEGIVCQIGMRYGNPSIHSGLQKLKEMGVTNVLLAPLFPQFAQATTESCLKEAYLQLSKMNWNPTSLELGHFSSDPSFIEPLAESIRTHLEDDSHLLFSYHGLPLSHIRRVKRLGKPNYVDHCQMTSSLVVESLGLSEDQWSMSYQSRLGPVKWLTPSTSQMVKKLAGEGKKKLIIASPAFIVDGLETLEELDIGIRECFNEHGGEKMTVVKCLNDNQDWIKGLESMIMKVFEKARN